ncbi:hypothetical protein BDV93DRAFT_550381 [Ceratobasidium sp. AG-I]|nr:hypothetical protein BDV93DRAFT_550381 [Ceratobasidium sp. AG-I]
MYPAHDGLYGYGGRHNVPLFPTHNSILADSPYIDIEHGINDVLVPSHDRSLSRSQTIYTYSPYALPELFSSHFPPYFPLPVSFDSTVQHQTPQGYNGEMGNIINNYFYNSVEVVHDGTVNPADLHRQADHARETLDTGVEIKEEYAQEGVQQGSSLLLYG